MLYPYGELGDVDLELQTDEAGNLMALDLLIMGSPPTAACHGTLVRPR